MTSWRTLDVMNDRWRELEELWRVKYSTAQALMRDRQGNPLALIEVAAQHPLVDGLYPNAEFRARLDRGKELFDRYAADGGKVEIYVPGSRHTFEGRPDRVSLSDAGRSYLVSTGVPSSAIHGEDLNSKYKGSEGVYGSADECFVAASYYKDAQFGTLISVCSPAQMLRKTLHYIEFGVVPLNVTAPTLSGFHDYVEELFEKVPLVLAVDPTFQGDSAEARRLREERRPDDDRRA
jgi:hypothetical protein